jgi:FtsP/CotA-like multicopper oxidase with cupredoxin domain
MKQLFYILFFAANLNGMAQDETTFLFSKMDIDAQHILWDNTPTMLMGYTSTMSANIDVPGPTLTYFEGDSVELKLRNMSQGASHTIHLHGLDVDQQNDGVPNLSFEVGHNETKSYFFKAPHPGTYLYHCHVTSALHAQAGMYGLLIVKPNTGINETWEGGYTYDSDYAWMTSELDLAWHEDSIINQPHDTTTNQVHLPDYNPTYFLVNGRSEQQLTEDGIPVIASANEIVLLRLANIGYYGNTYHFPMHLNARIISSDGRPFPSIEFSDSLTVMPGERYQVLLQSTYELEANIEIDYFSLNTLSVANTQNIPVSISGYFSQNESTNEIIKLYPNPSSDKVVFSKEINFIHLFDNNGRLLKTKRNSDYIDISDLAKGIYHLTIDSETNTIIKN